MRMHLKNKKLKLKRIRPKIKFTSKNLFIFLVSLFLVALLSGIIFFFLLNSSDKLSSTTDITSYFKIKNNLNYVHLLKNSFLGNTFNIFLIWVLGLSVIGVLLIIVIYFFHGFSLGFSIAAIFSKYGFKGIFGTFTYLFPSKICYLIILFFTSFFAIKISYKLIKLCFGGEDINMRKEMNTYFKLLLFSFISAILISLLEVFIDPFFIKLFV